MAGSADILERLPRLSRLLVEDIGARSGLDVDQGDVVSYDVMELTGDPQPLVGDPAQRLLFSRSLQLQRVGASAPDRVGEE